MIIFVSGDLVLVFGAKLTWILCDDVSTANGYGVLTDRCVGYVLEEHSVTVD